MTLGSKIKEERLNLNLTQEELGKKINLSKANISKYEKNILEPNVGTIKLVL